MTHATPYVLRITRLPVGRRASGFVQVAKSLPTAGPHPVHLQTNRARLSGNVRAIFISYRRHDSEGESGRLFDDLVREFGARFVFMDVATIGVGRDFRKAIDDSIATCGVLLAMIGPGWLDAQSERGGRRLDDPDDFVRIETASALRRGIPVIPVLVRRARVPPADHLPTDLADLAFRNAVELTHARWKSDAQILIDGLRPLVDDADADESTTAATVTMPIPTRRADLDPVALEMLTRDLARFIGPVAELVVKRAATRCASITALRRSVAQEIDSAADRARFLALPPAS